MSEGVSKRDVLESLSFKDLCRVRSDYGDVVVFLRTAKRRLSCSKVVGEYVDQFIVSCKEYIDISDDLLSQSQKEI